MSEFKIKYGMGEVILIMGCFIFCIIMLYSLVFYPMVANFDDANMDEISIVVFDKEIIRRPDGAFTKEVFRYSVETDKGTFDTDWDVYRQFVIGNEYTVKLGALNKGRIYWISKTGV